MSIDDFVKVGGTLTGAVVGNTITQYGLNSIYSGTAMASLGPLGYGLAVLTGTVAAAYGTYQLLKNKGGGSHAGAHSH